MPKGRTIGCKFNPYCTICREISKKTKHRAGLDVERDLVSKAWEKGLVAIRFAGSGSGTSKYPKSDVVLFDSGKIFAIEFKTTRPNQLPVRYFWMEYDGSGHKTGFFRTYQIAEGFYKNNFTNVKPVLRLKVMIPCKKKSVFIDAPIKKEMDVSFNFENWENMEIGAKFSDLKIVFEYRDNHWEPNKAKEEKGEEEEYATTI